MATSNGPTASTSTAPTGSPTPGLEPHSVSARFDFPAEEEKVLAYWREIDAFKEQVRQSEGKKPFSFYDGPPFATGLPHYGHLLMGTVKDVVTRYASTTGHHVERRFGWDTHGLPVEREIDKKLGINTKQDVMDMGIAKYNAECRAIVMRYSAEWRSTVERMGRWIDFDNDYKTLNPEFMESVWWVFGQLWQKDLVYKGVRVMPYSTALTTPLSNFEAGLDYRENTIDPAVTVSFPLVDDPKTALLAWTTTPWTLPSNLALCVHPELTYVKVHDSQRDLNFILCESLLRTVYGDKPKKDAFKKVQTYKGSELVGLKYEPLFDYFRAQYESRGAFRVVADTYVTDKDGTGVVHQSPAFGEDDHRISMREGIVKNDEVPPCPIDDAGRYTSEVPDFEGQYVKEADKPIMRHLKERGRLIVQGTINHSYPFCWRSGTPLLYRVMPVWFVRVQSITDRLVAAQDKTRWVPASVGEHRFKNWLKQARDWNISRNRYWGTPIPLWTSEDGQEIVAISSIAELERLSGVSPIKDLHRESIDHITIPSQQGKGVLRRVEEVFDCWFESGSMPYAQEHYPFENKDKFEGAFPAHFISEAMDQTRGWFYTLLVLAVHLFDKAPWQNLIVCGLVLAADGKKMSKSLKNYPDPNLVISKYGADATRLFLINSPVVRGDNLRFREEGVMEVVSRVLLPWLNSFRFFLTHTAIVNKQFGVEFKYDPAAPRSENVMDRWILARSQTLIQLVKEEMDAYRLYTVVPRLLTLIDELTNWYIRINRRRLKGEGGQQDALAALQSLFEALITLSRTLAPFTPFLAETTFAELRRYIVSPEKLGLGSDLRSVHFVPFPEARESAFDPVIERRVLRMQTVIDLVRQIRQDQQVMFKTPLREVVVYHPDQEYLDDIRSLQQYIIEELNVRDVSVTSDEVECGVQWRLTAEWPVIGRKLRGAVGKVKAALPNVSTAEVKQFLQTGQITVAGQPLVKEDLAAVRYVDLATATSTHVGDDDAPIYQSKTDSDVVVLLDTRVLPAFIEEATAKELLNRIQRARKQAGLVATDEIDVYISGTTPETTTELIRVATAQSVLVERVIRRLPKDVSELTSATQTFWETPEDSPAEVGELVFRLLFVRL